MHLKVKKRNNVHFYSKAMNMRNILIISGLAAIAAAVAIYFVNESNKESRDNLYDPEADIYDGYEDDEQPRLPRRFHSMT